MSRGRPALLVAHTALGGAALVLAAVAAGCTAGAGADPTDPAAARRRMVDLQIAARGVEDPRVLAALGEVPRHLFVPPELAGRAYADEPLPIGHEQTISQPYVVALMSELAELSPGERVLEIGTGSGYHAAVLARLAERVYTIEIVPQLADRARRTLAAIGADNVRVRTGDGYHGWPEAAPFDAVVLTAAPPEVPRPLLDQLAVGGRLVAPVGEAMQQLTVITRTPDGFRRELVAPVRFVPMTGEAGRPRDSG
ncbi:MAG TPA: protein-L-isoaspartate(D-aspartate) O-methyltransferase [Thermoanaerobaculia bacterium]|nr:protein-L-isoaspartate(D-aspartate) O-methyltransferase [Thermoanaerobaculia bacterium]